MDGERGRWEVVNDSDVEEEAYGIDIAHGGSDESQNNYENRTRASVISSVGQWTECMYNVWPFHKSYTRTEVKQVGGG